MWAQKMLGPATYAAEFMLLPLKVTESSSHRTVTVVTGFQHIRDIA